MPAYGSSAPTALSPGNSKILVNNETLGAGAASVSISRGASISQADQGITFQGNVAFTVQGSYTDVANSYVTVKDVNTTLPAPGFYQTTVDRFGFFRVVVTGGGAATIVAMR